MTASPRRSHGRTLQTRFLIALVAIGTLPLALVGGGVAVLAHEAVADQSSRELTGLARGIASQLQVYLNQLTVDTRTIATLPEIVSMDPARQQPILRDIFLQQASFSRLSTFDRDGNRLAASTPGGAASVRDVSAFLRAVERGELAWQTLVVPDTGRRAWAIYAPIRGPDRQVVGSVGAIVDLENLVAVVGQVGVGGNGRAVVLDENGRMLLDPGPEAPEGAAEAGRPAGWSAPIPPRPAGPGVARYPVEGELMVAGYAPVPSVGWTVVVERPEAEVLAPADWAWRIAIAGLAISLLLSVVVAVVLARRLTRPLQTLAVAAEALGRGDVAAPLPHLRADEGELSTLVRAFAEMRDRLAARSAEVEHLLEREQVARAQAESAERRTAFLAEASRALTASLDPQATFDELARLAVPALADVCTIDVVVPVEGLPTGRLAVAYHGPAQAELLAEMRDYLPDPDGPHPLWEVAGTGRSLLIPEQMPELPAGFTKRPGAQAHLGRLNPTSLLAVPLILRGRPVGALTLAATGGSRVYGPADLELAEELARRASVAIEHARLYRVAQQAIKARDEFLSVAAHELRTPITSLRGFAQLLARRIARTGSVEPARLQAALHTLDEQSRRLARLIDQLLDISRIEAGKLVIQREPADLADLARRAVATFADASAAHPIRLAAPVRLPALVDPLRLEQVLTNLIDNAIKYSPAGGPIEIEVAAPEPGKATLAVRDHGVGIPPERRGQIFDRFYQAHAEGNLGGMGLGLYICRQIVELHGGRISVEFPLDGGTRFVVRLPTAPVPGGESAGAGAAGERR